MKYTKAVHAMSLAALYFGLLSTTYGSTVSMAGIDDNFSGEAEPAFPSSQLVSSITNAGLGGIANFDVFTNDQNVAHTFSDLPAGIVSGTLDFRIRANNVPLIETDGITITFVDGFSTPFRNEKTYSRFFGQQPGDIGLVVPGVSWSPGMIADVTLDLSALPLANGGVLDLIPILNNQQFADIIIKDETSVDFMRLSVTTVPIPAAVWLFGTSVLVMVGVGRKKKRKTGTKGKPGQTTFSV